MIWSTHPQIQAYGRQAARLRSRAIGRAAKAVLTDLGRGARRPRPHRPADPAQAPRSAAAQPGQS